MAWTEFQSLSLGIKRIVSCYHFKARLADLHVGIVVSADSPSGISYWNLFTNNTGGFAEDSREQATGSHVTDLYHTL